MDETKQTVMSSASWWLRVVGGGLLMVCVFFWFMVALVWAAGDLTQTRPVIAVSCGTGVAIVLLAASGLCYIVDLLMEWPPKPLRRMR